MGQRPVASYTQDISLSGRIHFSRAREAAIAEPFGGKHESTDNGGYVSQGEDADRDGTTEE